MKISLLPREEKGEVKKKIEEKSLFSTFGLL